MPKIRIVMNICLLLVLFGMVQGFFCAQHAEAASSEDITMTVAVGLNTAARVGY